MMQKLVEHIVPYIVYLPLKAVVVARKMNFLVTYWQNECRYTHKTTTRTATKNNFSVMLTMQKYNVVYYVHKLNYNAYYLKLQCVLHKTTMRSTQNYNAYYTKLQANYVLYYKRTQLYYDTLHYATFPFFDSYRTYPFHTRMVYKTVPYACGTYHTRMV